MPAPDEPLALDVAERGVFIVPNGLVSRGRPGFDANGPLPASPSADGVSLGWVGELRPGHEPWLAVHAGVGPARLLVSWAAPRPSLLPQSNTPRSYRIESAAHSTRGGDGDFRLELRVTDNAAPARAHVIEFDGQSWVRITFEGVSVGAHVAMERLALHDASDGTDDVWLILGDELAREGLVPGSGEPGFAELLHERYPGYFPVLIDETRIGERPAAALGRVGELLEAHPHARRVAIAYGDAPNADGAAIEEASLASLVSRLLAHDRVVTIARTPRRGERRDGFARFNRVIAELEARHELLPGPDLGSWFDAHPDQLGDDGRPTAEGRRALQRLWLEALDVSYVPQ